MKKSEIKFYNGDYYIGEIDNYMMNGKGELRLKSGEIYKGTFLNNLVDG